MPPGMALHDYRGSDHPLFTSGLEAIVTGSAGSGFVQRLARWGIRVHATSETDPLAAVSALAAGEPLPPPAPNGH